MRRLRALVAAASLLVLASCGGEEHAPAVAETCSRVGERCRLSSNKLGVCQASRTGALHCADQH